VFKSVSRGPDSKVIWHPYDANMVLPYGLHMGTDVVCTRVTIWVLYG